MESLVVGDVVNVKSGDRVPADIRIIHSAGFKVTRDRSDLVYGVCNSVDLQVLLENKSLLCLFGTACVFFTVYATYPVSRSELPRFSKTDRQTDTLHTHKYMHAITLAAHAHRRRLTSHECS